MAYVSASRQPRKTARSRNLTFTLVAILTVCVLYQIATTYPSEGTSIPLDLLRLNSKTELECPTVLVLRTPKTASSTLADLLHQRIASVGTRCRRSYLANDKVLPQGQYTLKTEVLDDVDLSSYSIFCAHMNYTPEFRELIDAQRLYRIATLRGAEARAESLLAYEEKRISLVPVRPMLEYLGAPRLPPAVSSRDRMEESLSQAAIAKQIEAAMNHFHLIVVAEYWEMSLAVLMHDLRWRLVDLLLPAVNVQKSDAKIAAVKRVREKWGSARYYKWMIDIDTQLHSVAVRKLRHRFASLPEPYQRIPEAIRLLTPQLTKKCPTIKGRKHFRNREIQCFRKFRYELLKLAGVPGRVGRL